MTDKAYYYFYHYPRTNVKYTPNDRDGEGSFLILNKERFATKFVLKIAKRIARNGKIIYEHEKNRGKLSEGIM